MEPSNVDYILERWENFTAKLHSTQIMNSEFVEIPYPPLVNQSPPGVAPPPADAPRNEENVQHGNILMLNQQRPTHGAAHHPHHLK
ncbi:hypothetical protein SESBI_43945, partial [Sesbania bispinosa]